MQNNEKTKNETTLIPLASGDLARFTLGVQRAFKAAAVAALGDFDDEVVPPEDVERSANGPGARAFWIVRDGAEIGGAIVAVDAEKRRGSLDFLFVDGARQGEGAGFDAWRAIEAAFPRVELWETHTPEFDKRNVHFYVNKCGFHIVEYFHSGHCDPNDPEIFGDDEPEIFKDCGFFRFEKRMNVEENER